MTFPRLTAPHYVSKEVSKKVSQRQYKITRVMPAFSYSSPFLLIGLTATLTLSDYAFSAVFRKFSG
ncbi:hypothetical protein, partial [Plesiomonas sp.]|uniref:hypothetical protein n=1 Tax=Plesiomonas sp. TaxID=2486279 RepID=UPI003F2EF667